VHPGDATSLVLYWQKVPGQEPPEEWILSLRTKRKTIWQQPLSIAGGTLSAAEWNEGQIIRDKHQFILPDNLEPGKVELTLTTSGESTYYTIQTFILNTD